MEKYGKIWKILGIMGKSLELHGTKPETYGKSRFLTSLEMGRYWKSIEIQGKMLETSWEYNTYIYTHPHNVTNMGQSF